jgi:hypothetical protein
MEHAKFDPNILMKDAYKFHFATIEAEFLPGDKLVRWKVPSKFSVFKCGSQTIKLKNGAHIILSSSGRPSMLTCKNGDVTEVTLGDKDFYHVYTAIAEFENMISTLEKAEEEDIARTAAKKLGAERRAAYRDDDYDEDTVSFKELALTQQRSALYDTWRNLMGLPITKWK